MIEFEQVTVDRWDRRIGTPEYSGRFNRALKDYVDDMAEMVHREAVRNAPMGDTGELKNRGIILTKGGIRRLNYQDKSGRWREFGSSRFSPGNVGRATFEASVELNPEVEHAIWVHDGTGLYGPNKTRIVPTHFRFMLFNINGKWFQRESVAGQKAQPFLTNAYEYVNNVYGPAKLSELRAEIAARS